MSPVCTEASVCGLPSDLGPGHLRVLLSLPHSAMSSPLRGQSASVLLWPVYLHEKQDCLRFTVTSLRKRESVPSRGEVLSVNRVACK